MPMAMCTVHGQTVTRSVTLDLEPALAATAKCGTTSVMYRTANQVRRVV